MLLSLVDTTSSADASTDPSPGSSSHAQSLLEAAAGQRSSDLLIAADEWIDGPIRGRL